MFWLGIAIGLFIGASLGALFMGMCISGKMEDRYTNSNFEKQDKLEIWNQMPVNQGNSIKKQ